MMELGLNPLKIISYRFLFRFLKERKNFIQLGGGPVKFYPVLDNYAGDAGAVKSHYFHQDLLVASFIYEKKPKRHIDVGSRVDGFVAHVASFRKIEVFDVRPLELINYDNIDFVQADLMSEIFVHENRFVPSP